MYHIAGDFNLNLLHHKNRKKMQDFLNLVDQNGMIPTINKPIEVTRETVTAIDHILTNTFVDWTFKSDVFKSSVSGHFPVIFLIPSINLSNENGTSYIYKRFVTDEAITSFNISLYQNNWKEFLECESVNQAYANFIDKFSEMCDNFFPIKKMKLKSKDLKIPWITQRAKRSSKRKQ